MGLFDSIRRVVGGGTDDSDDSDGAATQPDLVDTRDLDASALRERAAGVAGEVELLDFSLDSLAQFDDAIDNGYDEALATTDEPATYATDTVRFGCYLGEVLVRVYGGEWTRDPDWGVTLSGPDGTTTVAVFDVAERSITTGAVFAAVADRAAAEVGLAGPPAGPGSSTGAQDDATDEDAGAAAEATPTDAASADSTVSTAAEDSTAKAPSDEPTTETAAEDDANPHAFAPDEPADATDETDREPVDDAASLIEEAEPEPPDTSDPAGEADAAEPAAASGTAPPDSSTVPDDSPPPSEERSDSAAQDGTDSPSLFDDTSADAGPTLEDAPSADDGAPVDASVPEPDGSDDPADATDTAGDTDGSDDPDSAPTAGDDRRATHAEAAEELVSFWTEYDLDYTAASLGRLDALVSEEWDDDRFDDADFGSDDSFDDRVFTSVSTELGSYFGEVLVRELDAEWSDEATADGVVVKGADGPLAIPVFKVAGTSIKQQPVFQRSFDSLLSDLEPDG